MKNSAVALILFAFGVMIATDAYARKSDDGLGVCEGVGLRIWHKRQRTINDEMAGWIGTLAPEVVARWGAPNAQFTNPDGTRMLTWNDGYGCTRTFQVDAQQTLVRWGVGPDCSCKIRGLLPGKTPVPKMTL